MEILTGPENVPEDMSGVFKQKYFLPLIKVKTLRKFSIIPITQPDFRNIPSPRPLGVGG